MSKYVPPQLGDEYFNCPHCEELAKHWWGAVSMGTNRARFKNSVNAISCSACEECGNISIWKHDGCMGKIIYPTYGQTRKPHMRMPKDLLPLYREAQSVYPHSPRAASALLRGLLLWLMPYLGQNPGQRLNQSILNLSRKGLSPKVKDMLAANRAVGGNAVEPGRIAHDDTFESAEGLFEAINLLVEELIEPVSYQKNLSRTPYVFESPSVPAERPKRV